MTCHLLNKAAVKQNCIEALNQHAQPLKKKAALSSFTRNFGIRRPIPLRNETAEQLIGSSDVIPSQLAEIGNNFPAQRRPVWLTCEPLQAQLLACVLCCMPYYCYCHYFLTPVLNSQGMKKLRYAIQKVQKSSWNERYFSSSFTKQSCSRMALYRWIKRESH